MTFETQQLPDQRVMLIAWSGLVVLDVLEYDADEMTKAEAVKELKRRIRATK